MRGLESMVSRFYWLIDGQLAGCARPGQYRSDPHDASGGSETGAAAALDRDIAWLRCQGIRAVLSLTETPLPNDVLGRHGMNVLHIPVPDLQPPTPEGLLRALGFIDRQQSMSRPVAVHCLAGQGRTGTVLAAYRIRAGASPQQALRELREICPGAVSAEVQERALEAFAARRDWIL